LAIDVPTTRSSASTVDSVAPVDVAIDRCKGCGLCARICRDTVFTVFARPRSI
jgi:Pyruvate/2-oxoacid:ferredoxin oxidoreductase delta subunit